MAHRVLIIGGGAVGLASAHYLSEAGAEVTVLERSVPGSGASPGNAGLVVPSHFVPLAAPGMVRQGLRWMLDPASPFYIKPRLDPGLMAWLWHFARACTRRRMQRSIPVLRELTQESRRRFEDLARTLPPFGFERRGLLMLHRSEAGRHACLEEAELGHGLGIAAEVLDADGIQRLEPGLRFRATGGVHYPGDAHLDPRAWTTAMAAHLGARGVRIYTGTPVTGLERLGGRITCAHTPAGPFEADAFVLAGGAQAPELLRPLGLRLPMQAGKGYSLTWARSPRPARTPMILTEARVAFTPMGERLRLAGTMELAGPDTALNPRRIAAIAAAVPQYLADFPLEAPERAERWAGLRPCTPDGLPYLGVFRDCPNLVAATGHAMLGITLAPVTGHLVAQILGGAKPDLDLAPLDPQRYG